MTQQLLIGMPAEGAARLLTLSLLEQLLQGGSTTMLTTQVAVGNPGRVAPSSTYQIVLGRLRGCMTLYADALAGAISRKTRRHLRTLGATVQQLQQADSQLGWITRYTHARVDHADANAGVNGDGLVAARWIYDRLERRRLRAERSFERLSAMPRPLRRLAKRLGVYKTAVRIDEMPTQRSFASLTGAGIVATTTRLTEALATLQSGADPRAVRRALRATIQLTYLLEPLRAYADVDDLARDANDLRTALQRLDDLAVVGRAVIRSGRRIGATHATERLRGIIWPPKSIPTADGVPVADAPNVVSLAMLQRGLVVVAHAVRDESTAAFDAFATTWLSTRATLFMEQMAHVGANLDG